MAGYVRCHEIKVYLSRDELRAIHAYAHVTGRTASGLLRFLARAEMRKHPRDGVSWPAGGSEYDFAEKTR